MQAGGACQPNVFIRLYRTQGREHWAAAAVIHTDTSSDRVSVVVMEPLLHTTPYWEHEEIWARRNQVQHSRITK